MKFYSYSNKNNDYTRAVSLKNVRVVETYIGSGKREICYGVRITYYDNSTELFSWLGYDEAKAVYKQIVDLLNG